MYNLRIAFFSNKCLNFIRGTWPARRSPMATSVLTKPAAKGGSFLLESPAPQDVFTPADLTDDQKLIGQTAEEFVIKEVFPLVQRPGSQEARPDGGASAKGRGTRPDERWHPRRVRRRGPRQDFHHRADGKTFDLRRLCGHARRARGHRHAAHRLFRHGRAKEKSICRNWPAAN